MNVSIIIIHWNTPDLLEKQLMALGRPEDGEVIVIDNGTPDFSAAFKKLNKQFPYVQWILNPLNKGFAFACNQGWQAAYGEWLLFLNPDVQLTLQDIDDLIVRTDHQGWSAASPAFSSLNYRKPVPSFLSLSVEFSLLRHFFPLSFLGKKTLTGGCLLIKKKALDQINGWDERFFLWFEDSDLSKRLAQHNIPYGFVSRTSIQHEGGKSFTSFETAYQRHLFFAALRTYARKYFHPIQRACLRLLTRRFSNNALLPADPQIEVSIVVPNMHAQILKEFLKRNIHTFQFETQELIVVTSDKNVVKLRAEYPQVIFILLDKNFGFAHTVNTGFQRARGQYMGTVNDDTELPRKWIEHLLEHAETKVGSISPQVMKTNGKVESVGVNVLPSGKAVLVTDVKTANIHTDAFNAACVLFSRKALEKVGLFDERFGSYLEDIDLGLRLKKAGWKNRAVTEVSIIHYGQQTSKRLSWKKQWLDVKNWWLVCVKNFSLSHWFRYFPGILLERGRNMSGLLKAVR